MGFHQINPLVRCVLLLYTLCTLVFGVDAYYKNPGETYPDRVEIAVGASINISCRMNPEMFPGQNARDLYFIDVNKQNRVPDSEIFIHNETTIVYMLKNSAEQQNEFLCKCGADAIMSTPVFAGYRPLPVRHFACRSYDYEFMVCNFTQPRNPVLTQYNLTFHLKSPAYSYDPTCSYEEKPLVICNLTLDSSTPSYHPLEQLYHFTLSSGNALGNVLQHFDIRNREVMVPAEPGRDFRVLNLTADALTCAWRMPKWQHYHSGGSRGLVWEVLLLPHDFPAMNLSSTVRIQHRNEGNDNQLHLHLTALPYAWWWYELRLRVRVRNSGRLPHMWSSPFVYRFRTAAQRPARPPRSTPGGFYVDSMETHVRVYWEQLAASEYNGENFTYVVSEVRKDNRSIQLAPLQLEANSAVFDWQRDSDYEYKIRSRNHMGDSVEARVIAINARTRRNYPEAHSPHFIHNVYHGSNHSYTLTWQAPERSEQLRDYTVYWCNSKRAMQNECKGSIHFRTLNRTTHKFNTDPQAPDQEHSLNLAVSANYLDGYSTGMQWTSCNSDQNSDLIKMEPDAFAKNATAILVQWSPESVCPSILVGYNLTICEVAKSSDDFTTTITSTTTANLSAEHASCLDSPRRFTINRDSKKHVIGQLKPFTRYKVEMLMFSRLKIGKPSDALFVRTAETAPTPPRQLQVSHVTNTSAIISWMPPSGPNGRMQPYLVIINNQQIEVSAADDVEADPLAKIVYKLENLTAYMSYKVYVVARTVNISEPSNDVHFMTRIGYPAMPGNINSVRINDTEQIHWKKPDLAAGRIEFYEVAVTQRLRGGEVVKRRISTLLGATTTTCSLRTPACLDPDHETTIEVRAVNAAANIGDFVNDDEFRWNSFDDSYASVFFDANDELTCQGGGEHSSPHSSDILERYHNATLYRLYKSPWLTAKTIGCHANRISEITIIALAVVMMSLGVMAALYVARKQYNKMANIHCTLPAGLDTYVTKESGPRFPGDFISTAEEEDTPHLQRTQAFIRNNEKFHLLASVGNDSGYLGGGEGGRTPLSTSVVDADGNVSGCETAGAAAGYLRTHSESSTDSLVGSTNSAETVEAAAAADELPEQPEVYCNILASEPLQRILEDDYIASPLATNVNNATNLCGYVLPSEIHKMAVTAPAQSQPLLPEPSQNPFAHTTNLSGYTTLAELSKVSAGIELPEIPPPPLHGSISGYVTQRELNVFGQQQQQQPQFN